MSSFTFSQFHGYKQDELGTVETLFHCHLNVLFMLKSCDRHKSGDHKHASTETIFIENQL